MSQRTMMVAAVVVSLGLPGLRTSAAEPTSKPEPSQKDLERTLADTVRPFLAANCFSCHGAEKKKADIDLRPYTKLATVVRDHAQWEVVLEKLEAKQMPPENAAAQPSADDRQKVIDWIQAVRWNEARRTAGDPGAVMARRLSNAEYNYTIRDLTGVDMRPTREFPVDPANPAGFDNSGESLAMSPALLAKYLQAARDVANHLVLRPDAIAFAPHPMLVETDRDKYCVNQIIDFYRRQATDYADYFHAAWRYKHRAALGLAQASLADVAAGSKVSPGYLALVWKTLEETPEAVGPVAKLQGMWRALPAPAGKEDAARAGSVKMRDFVVQLRRKIEVRFQPPSVPGVRGTAQPFLMWRNKQYATHRTDYDRKALQIDGKGGGPVAVAAAKPRKDDNADEPDDDEPAAPARGKGVDPDLVVPAAQRAAYEASFARFASVFPDAFYVSERGRNYLDKSKDKGRYLSAGFHNLMGYFRDDQPLYDLILDDAGKKQLDGMWRDLDYVAAATERTYLQFFLSESGEARSRAAGEGKIPDKDVTAEKAILKVKESFLTKARPSGNEVAIKAIADHFDSVNATIRWVEKARVDAEPKHLAALADFAERAYRRPLTAAERRELQTDYRNLRKKAGLEHEEAMRDSIVSILMSPDFCYRVDLGSPSMGGGHAAGGAVKALSDWALASRLSYFLWSSAPDAELLSHARAGDLHRPEVLLAQARRLLKDDKVRGLATEFGGNWLDFRRFEEHNAVDRERFPTFTNDLRQAMFEEPVRFMLDVFQENRPVLDFLYGKHTFVNGPLAKHYGMPDVKGTDTWVRVEDADTYGRGGLLPMSVFLTKNAPGLRTSPVKRGYWVVKTVLGERIPPPPAAVPELPRDEAKADLPLHQLLARHREDPSCASCHARFDSMGLVLEGYGPVGEKRTKDLAGRPVEARASFPGGGGEGTGLQGLREYVRTHRQADFLDNLARKLLAYGLSRSLTLSDEPTIVDMRTKLERDGYRFDSLIESVVTSHQFLNKRMPTTVALALRESR